MHSKEQANTVGQLREEVKKMKTLSSKEMKLNGQQKEQNDKLNEEIRNVLNLIQFEEAKLAKGQIDE